MWGAIVGDIVGSLYELRPCRAADFPLFQRDSHFSDDTVLTVATAFALMTDGDYAANYRMFGRLYPHAGYGERFRAWLNADEPQPYGSWGNGSAMRVSPIGFAFASEQEVWREAGRSAAVTHDHPDGIAGARAVALAVWLARNGATQAEICAKVTARCGYDLGRSLAEVRVNYGYEIACRKSVPEALIAFLAAEDYESAVRNAVLLGGDADTQATIAGGVAEAFYGEVPAPIVGEARARLPGDLLQVIDDFYARYRP